VSGSYDRFDRSGFRIRYMGVVQFTGELRGDWIHLDGGGKKKADSKYIQYEVEE